MAGGTILNALFAAALMNVQVSSVTGVFSVAGFLMIYARACTTLVAGVFALQAYLPDHVINFRADVTELICWGIWFLPSKILLPAETPIYAEHLAFVKRN